MSAWREHRARRDVREHARERGMVVLYDLIGWGVAALLVIIGTWCFVVDAIPIATRVGKLMIGGTRKLGFGILALSLGVALNCGFAWTRVPVLRRCWLPALCVSLLGALIGTVLTI